MHKCLDMNRIHFIEGDTDSMYWAVAGCPNDDNKQDFKHVVIDKEFYDANVFKFMPYDTFCFNPESRPTIQSMIDDLLNVCTLASQKSLLKCLGGVDLKDLRAILSLPENEAFVKKSHEKKLLGLAIEKQGDNMIALGPKCYTSWNNDNKTLSLKMKGVQKNQNKHITYESC